ncbi:MAG: glycosyltransferase [Alphaproteobacteria bacterium]|uniref:Glycosyltransferase n=1 Tax=Candidatus Nitrobium versatile TaxID=2884831 RepID=A0A953JCD3_9BACT|nr:glycosyltransferase [Candidatus Nitrobium versatile]
MNSGFWALLPIRKTETDTGTRRSLSLALRAVLDNGETAEAHLGDIALSPGYREEGTVLTGSLSAGSLPARPLPGMPRVAICMATYDPGPEQFSRQIDSIRQQTYTDWICIINDDCSPPGAFEMIKSVVANDSRFFVHRNSANLGYYYNFERCLSLVPEGVPLVALSDQDDYWHPDKLEALLSHMDDETVLVFSDMNIVNTRGEILSPTYWTDRKNNFRELDLMILANTVTGTSCLFRKGLLRYLLPFHEKIGDSYHDHFIAIVALALGKVQYVERPLFDYYQHDDNVVGHYTREKFFKSMQIWHENHPVGSVLERIHSDIGRLKDAIRLYRTIYSIHYTRRALMGAVLELRCSTIAGEKKRIIRRFSGLERSPLGLLVPLMKEVMLRRNAVTFGIARLLLKSYGSYKAVNIYHKLKRKAFKAS